MRRGVSAQHCQIYLAVKGGRLQRRGAHVGGTEVGSGCEVAVIPCNLPDAPERRMLFSPHGSLLTPQRRTPTPNSSSSGLTSGNLANPRPASWPCSLCFIPGFADDPVDRCRSIPRRAPIDDPIDGRSVAGRSDEYRQAWAAGRMRVLRRRFEDMLVYPAKVIHDIARFLGLPRPENPPLLDAKRAHERNLIRRPTEGIEGCRSPIGIDVWAHIGNLHSETARRGLS